jgi:hypothetical protein
MVTAMVPIVMLITVRGLDKDKKLRESMGDRLESLAKEVSNNTRGLSVLEERLKNHINGTKT